jgi:lysylphosphatidylglycerol synthetase-like protein (DUF2156 family)
VRETWGARAAGLLVLLTTPFVLVPGLLRFLGGAPPVPDRIALAVTLLLLARGLIGCRRSARQATLVLVAVAAAVPPYRPERILPLAAVAALLLAYPGNYVVRPDPRRLRAAGAATVAALAAILARGGWMAVWHRAPVRQAASAALPLLPDASSRSTRVFVVGVLAALVVALLLVLAPAPAPPPSGPAERDRVRALVQHPDSGSLAPFATRADKTYVFSPDGAAVIGYRVRFGVALAGGDPVGAAGSAAAAVTAFTDLCAARGWRPAVLGAASVTGAVWRDAGVRRAIEIGDEAVLDVPAFSLVSRRMRNLRQAVSRTVTAGVQVRIGALDPHLAAQLAPILRDWLHGRAERGFAMNLDRILGPRDEMLTAVAYDAAGSPRAFARFARVAGGRVLSLDVAPRGKGAPNGVVERLIVDTVAYAREHGAAEVSLNFAGMRRVYAGRSLAARLAQVPLRLLDRWIELRSLYRFTDKFHPRWRPRQLRMRSWLDLVPVATAALTAEFGGTRPESPPAPEQVPATVTP